MTLRHSQALMPDLLHRQLIPSAFMESVIGTFAGIYLHSDTSRWLELAAAQGKVEEEKYNHCESPYLLHLLRNSDGYEESWSHRG